jgi:LysM repeat protein
VEEIMRKSVSLFVLAAVIAGMTLAFAPAAEAQSGGLYCTRTHVVQRGENLFRIGLRYNTTWTTLAAINGISNPARIYAGQTLCISQSGWHNPGQPLPGTHTVQPGDTLSQIARRYGISMTVLAQVNGITNVNRIYAGQVLRIPEVTIQ